MEKYRYYDLNCIHVRISMKKKRFFSTRTDANSIKGLFTKNAGERKGEVIGEKK